MDPYVGEIRRFPYASIPSGWLACDGQLLSVSDYTELFSLLAMSYGGNGSTTFALPDLRGKVPAGQDGSFLVGQSLAGSGTSEEYLTVVYAIAVSGTYPPEEGA